MKEIIFNEENKTLYLKGDFYLVWMDIANYADVCEHIVIEDGVKANDCNFTFCNFVNLLDIKGKLDTSECTDFDFMFNNCNSLVSVECLIDTSNGTTFRHMFANNFRLKKLPINETYKGIYFSNMLDDCNELELDIEISIPTYEQPCDVTNIKRLVEKITHNEDRD